MVVNYDAGTYKVVFVDAGNGSVLYTSDSLTLQNGGLGCGGGWGHNHHHHFGGNMNWGNKGSSSSSRELNTVYAAHVHSKKVGYYCNDIGYVLNQCLMFLEVGDRDGGLYSHCFKRLVDAG